MEREQDYRGAVNTPAQYVPGTIWLVPYPVALGGARFEARMTIIRLGSGSLVIHSPGPLDDDLCDWIRALGRVAVIVAPGNFHHLHVAACQRAFPDARTWICPGVQRRDHAMRFDGVLGDQLPASMQDEFEQVLVRGRLMAEVALLHRPTRTLLLVDLVERFCDDTPNVKWLLRACWKALGMWNRPTLAPEYRIVGWNDRAAARRALERILAWDFQRVVIAHGELIQCNAKDVLRRAWRNVLA
ncbi:MAG: DUF4336 domain-containing protein [Luteimonas sp.]